MKVEQTSEERKGTERKSEGEKFGFRNWFLLCDVVVVRLYFLVPVHHELGCMSQVKTYSDFRNARFVDE